jgi:hypothetical protein
MLNREEKAMTDDKKTPYYCHKERKYLTEKEARLHTRLGHSVDYLPEAELAEIERAAEEAGELEL